MSKETARNYKRLIHVRGSNGDYNRDNYQNILEKSLKSRDIYVRDYYFVSSNSTDDYASKLSSEKWKDFSTVGDDPAVEYNEDITMLKIIDMENHILKFLDSEKDQEFLKVYIFFTLIHNIYPKFSDDIKVKTNDMKQELIIAIRDFQSHKDNMSRKSKITTSYLKFLVKELGITRAFVRKHINRYKRLMTTIFPNFSM